MVPIEGWDRDKSQAWVYAENKNVFLNVEKYIPESVEKMKRQDPQIVEKLSKFAIGRTAFQNNAADICRYIDYFIENYDVDRELPCIYLSIKNIIDDGKYQLTDVEFKTSLYRRLFTSNIKKRVYRLVHDNYHMDITVDAKTGRVYNAEGDFTNEDARRFLAISTVMKMAIPAAEHFLSVYKQYSSDASNQDIIVDIFKEIFYEIGSVTDEELVLYGERDHVSTIDVLDYIEETTGNVLTPDDLADLEEQAADDLMLKLYNFVNGRLRKHSKNNQLLWSQQSALRGLTEDGHRDRLMSKYIFYDNFFKFNFRDNLVSFLQSIIGTQLKYTINITKYKKDPIRVDNVKGAEGLSSIDKLEQSMVKIDETQVVRTEISIIDVLERLEAQVGPISDEEIDYYSKYPINTNAFRNYLLENLYAKKFGGFSELRSMPDRFYTKLGIIAKRRLKAEGYQELPSFMTSIVQGRISNRLLQNTKYISKVKQSGTYQHLMEDNYKALKGFRDDMIIEDESRLLNTQYAYVEYDTPEVTGEPIVFNEDVISDEYMTALDNV